METSEDEEAKKKEAAKAKGEKAISEKELSQEVVIYLSESETQMVFYIPGTIVP